MHRNPLLATAARSNWSVCVNDVLSVEVDAGELLAGLRDGVKMEFETSLVLHVDGCEFQRGFAWISH